MTIINSNAARVDDGRSTGTAHILHGLPRRIFNEAPYLPRCSDDKSARLVRPREFVHRQPYMQVNRQGMVSWLVFDLDVEPGLPAPDPFGWEEQGLPAPNLIVSDPITQSTHLFYAIVPVCTTEQARSRPINYMKAVREAMRIALRGDSAYSGPVAKTPHHPRWVTTELHTHEYELDELAKYVELKISPFRFRKPTLVHSRHCQLFDDVRHVAYATVEAARSESSYEAFYRSLEHEAASRNNFAGRGEFTANLSASQVRATVRSIARWTWDRYRGQGSVHRGVMQLDEAMPLQERQALAAVRSAGLRRQRMDTKIFNAVLTLRREGKTITQKAIAAVARVSRQTVAKRSEEISRAKIIDLVNRPAQSAPDVKFAVHQISAGSGLTAKSRSVQIIGNSPAPTDCPRAGPGLFDP